MLVPVPDLRYRKSPPRLREREIELKACPVCLGEQFYIRPGMGNEADPWEIQCKGCMAATDWHPTPEEAGVGWNHRTDIRYGKLKPAIVNELPGISDAGCDNRWWQLPTGNPSITQAAFWRFYPSLVWPSNPAYIHITAVDYQSSHRLLVEGHAFYPDFDDLGDQTGFMEYVESAAYETELAELLARKRGRSMQWDLESSNWGEIQRKQAWETHMQRARQLAADWLPVAHAWMERKIEEAAWVSAPRLTVQTSNPIAAMLLRQNLGRLAGWANWLDDTRVQLPDFPPTLALVERLRGVAAGLNERIEILA